MELFLIRKFFKDRYTIGKLYNENTFICNTLEDKIRDLNDLNHDGDFDDLNEGKVYGETAIPCGRYKVIVSMSHAIGRMLPLLLDVPGFTGIRIHSGATERNTKGCILVGENKRKGELINGPYYETYVRDMIETAIAKFEPVYITIKE